MSKGCMVADEVQCDEWDILCGVISKLILFIISSESSGYTNSG